MGLEQQIRETLQTAFEPDVLEVINDSHRHAGHAGDDGSGESHWKVVIASPAFADMSRVARHRAIHTALGADIIGRIHALSLDIS
ncbi:MAG: BolA family transcriptional regulator [Octadecabacter sp.]|nr:BolA family transcriptional regulator [Octadecabacter sp.]